MISKKIGLRVLSVFIAAFFVLLIFLGADLVQARCEVGNCTGCGTLGGHGKSYVCDKWCYCETACGTFPGTCFGYECCDTAKDCSVTTVNAYEGCDCDPSGGCGLDCWAECGGGGGGGCSCTPTCPEELSKPGNITGVKIVPPYDTNTAHTRIAPSASGYDHAWVSWDRLTDWGADGVSCQCQDDTCEECEESSKTDNAYYQVQYKAGTCGGAYTDVTTLTNPASGKPTFNLHQYVTLNPDSQYCLRVRAINPGDNPGGDYSIGCDSYGNWRTFSFFTDQLPKVGQVRIFDSDYNGAAVGSEITSSNVWIGTLGETDNPRRCDGKLVFNAEGNAVDCVPGVEQDGWIAQKSDRNPFEIEIDVTDPDGVNDVLYSALWVQDTTYLDNGTFYPINPPYSDGKRRSFQFVLAGEHDQSISGDWHWVPYLDSGPDGTSIVDRYLETWEGYRALRFRDQLGTYDYGKGWWSQSDQCNASALEWLTAGYDGSNSEIPSGATSTVDTGCGGSSWRQYIWDVTPHFYQPAVCISAVDQQSRAMDWTWCIDNEECTACIDPLPPSEVDSDTIRIRARLGITGQAHNEMNFGVFANVIDKQGFTNEVSADFAGWKQIGADGEPCDWNGSAWDCHGAGKARIKVDYDGPVGSTFLTEVGSDKYEFNYDEKNMSDPGSGLDGYYGRVAEHLPTGELDWAYLKVKSNDDPVYAYDNFINGRDYRSSYDTSDVLIGLVGGGDTVRAALYVYDNAGNSTFLLDSACLSGNCSAVDVGWMKTSLGDVFSQGGYQIQLANTDADSTLEEDLLDTFFDIQGSTLSTFILKKSSGEFPTGGYIVGTQKQQGYYQNYNNEVFYSDISYNDNNNSLLSPNNAAPQSNWFDRLNTMIFQNKERLGDEAQETDISNLVNEIPGAEFKIMTVNSNVELENEVSFKQKNIILVDGGTLTIHRLTADTEDDICLVIVGNNGQVIIDDHNEVGTLSDTIDYVEAGFIVDDGGSFVVSEQPDPGTDLRDRLIIKGFVFSATSNSVAPTFERDLVFEDNEDYPAEWIVYDARFVRDFKALMGDYRYGQYECGLVEAPECEVAP